MRYYSQGDLYVEETPVQGGGTERSVNLRFKTRDFVGGKESAGVTPWVDFSLAGLERLSEQLAAVAETAKRWEPGKEASVIGSSIGVATVAPFDVDADS